MARSFFELRAPLVEDLDPAGIVLGLISNEVEADNLRATETAGETDKQHRPVAQAPQRAAVEHLQHGDQILGQNAFLLTRRCGLGVADAGEHGGDVTVLAVEDRAALGEGPGERRLLPFDGRHSVGAEAAFARGTGSDVEADYLRVGNEGVETLRRHQPAKCFQSEA